MATRNQVLSLFGATPEQIMQQERARQAEFLAAQRDPFQSAGAAIGVGLGRLFGGEPEGVAQARQMQEAVAGIDPNNPEALRALAQTVSSFAPERALQIAAYATQLEEGKRGRPVNFERQAVDENGQPIFRQTFNALGEPTGQTPVMVSVPHVRGPEGEYIPLDPRYANLGGAQATANANDSQVALQPDFIVDPETNRLVPNPAKSGQAPATQEPFEVQQDPRITPEAQEAMTSATGPRGGGSMGSITAVPPPPKFTPEPIFGVEALQKEAERLQSELNALPRTSRRRRELQRQINEIKVRKRQAQKATKPKQGTTRTRGR